MLDPTRPVPQRRCRLSWTLLCAAALLGACATSAPVVYPHANADAARVARDTDECRRLAEAAVGLNGRSAGSVAKDSGQAGAVAFIATAVGAAVNESKNVWQRARVAAAGGASGVAAKVLLDWNEPDKVHQEYVERCMKRRGHDVLGWR